MVDLAVQIASFIFLAWAAIFAFNFVVAFWEYIWPVLAVAGVVSIGLYYVYV